MTDQQVADRILDNVYNGATTEQAVDECLYETDTNCTQVWRVALRLIAAGHIEPETLED